MTVYDLTRAVPRNKDEVAWFYNGIDCLVTYELFTDLHEQIERAPSEVGWTYRFALQKQVPIMEMELRGVRMSPAQVARLLKRLTADHANLLSKYEMLCDGVFNRRFNYRSPKQVKELFYEYLALPTVKKRNTKGVWAPSVDLEALEKLKQHYTAIPFAILIAAMRDIWKQIGFLNKTTGGDRLYTSFNVAGTNTGRLASRASDFGSGTNLQNVDRRLRTCFVADKGHVLVNVDLEQADSRNVGAKCYELFVEEFGKDTAGRYLDACESSDLHTSVCLLVWPGITDVLDTYYRNESYRQTAKKLGHATNYFASPVSLGKRVSIPTQIVKNFQRLYFQSFPCIKMWHQWVAAQMNDYPATLTTLYGRRRRFWGRSKEDATLREMLAYEPQSMTGHQIDAALEAVWRTYPSVQLLVQVHDSILFQLPIKHEHLIPKIKQTMTDAYTLILKGDREFYVPVEAKTGSNWGDYDEEHNPTGLQKV